MGRYNSYIEVEIDLDNYEDQIIDYMEPDNINDALDMMERWGYSDGDILDHMLEDMDNELFLSKIADLLTVDTALDLVKKVYQYGDTIRIRNMTAKDNQIAELKQRVDDLLALKRTVIKESNHGDS
jgi:hypothetical protein